MKYDSDHYVEQIVNEDPDEMKYEVSTMSSIRLNMFKFSTRLDKNWYSRDHIVKTISQPVPITRNGRTDKLADEDG